MRTMCAGAVALVLLSGCAPSQPEATPWDTSDTTYGLHVALVTLRASLHAGENRQRMRESVQEVVAAHPEVRLITFGETSLGWYFKAFDPRYQWSVAEALDGPTVTEMRGLAREHGVYIAFGFAEVDGWKLYDAAVMINDQGDVIAHRRKSNFVPMDRLSGFSPGEKKLTTASIDGIKVALLICNDINDESYQEEVANTPDIKAVVLPQASGGLHPDTVRHSAYQFPGQWLLAPQRFGREAENRYYGSWLLDPNGYMVASVGGPDVTVYELRFKD